ncbi:hypothetical protein PCE1_002197 [Barthelona sp. PCE]
MIRRLRKKDELHLMERRILATYISYYSNTNIEYSDMEKLLKMSDKYLIETVAKCPDKRWKHFLSFPAIFGIPHDANPFILDYLTNCVNLGCLKFENDDIDFSTIKRTRRIIVDFTLEGVRFISILFLLIPVFNLSLLHNIACRVGRRAYFSHFTIHKKLDPNRKRRLGIKKLSSRFIFTSNIMLFIFELIWLIVGTFINNNLLFNTLFGIYVIFWMIIAFRETKKETSRRLNPFSSFTKIHNDGNLATQEAKEALQILKTVISKSPLISRNSSTIHSPTASNDFYFNSQGGMTPVQNSPLVVDEFEIDSETESEQDLCDEIYTMAEDFISEFTNFSDEERVERVARSLSRCSSSLSSRRYSVDTNSGSFTEQLNSYADLVTEELYCCMDYDGYRQSLAIDDFEMDKLHQQLNGISNLEETILLV